MMRHVLIPALLLAAPAALAKDASQGSLSRATTFTVRIENVSTPTTLRSRSGETAPAPNSPGLWAIHRKPAPLFRAGKPDLGWGMESQAEDGDPTKLAEHCMHHEIVSASGVFNVPAGDEQPGPALPGKRYEFTVTARPGDRLSLVTMFGQSNDWFYATDEKGIALFQGSRPVSGDVTAQIQLWDAGTEVDQEPGFGPDQAPRQKAPNTGASERKPVGKVSGGFPHPRTAEVIRVTLTPSQTMAQH